MFNPKTYWNNRLVKSYSLSGVGDITLGKYNLYLYFIRKIAFKNIIGKLNISPSDTAADIGSGTGFYIDLWSQTKAKKIYGIDISEHAVTQLSQRYNSNRYDFFEADISTDKVPISKLDYVSAFDMFYHIVDDEKYAMAFKRINKMLKNKGIFIFSDNLIKQGKEHRLEHQVCRNKKFVLKTIENAGFQTIKIKPMFVLMNQSFYPNNPFSKYVFPHSAKFIQKSNFWAHVFGILLTPIEALLILFLKKSFSTEIVVCKKIKKL